MINIKNSDKNGNNMNQKETPIVFDYRKFNFSKLEYIEPKKKGNVVSSSIYYRASINKVINLFIRTPLMCTVSGICKKNNNYYIDLELDITNKHCDFYDFMNKFDNNNKQVVFQNSVEWFNEQLPLDVIDEFYIPSVTLVSGGKLPIIRVKIKSKGDIIIPKIFNNYGAEVDLSYVSPKDEIEAVVILDELKFFKEKFTPEWSLGQLKVFKKKFKSIKIPDQYLLADENDLHEQESEQIYENESENVNGGEIDSDEEEDQQIKQFLEKKKIMEMKQQEEINLKILDPNTETERLEKERIEQERIEQERIEQERLEQERLEQERLEQERLKQERLEQERLEQERLEQERLEQERLKKEKIRLEKIKKLELLRLHEEKIKFEHEQLIKQMREIEDANDEEIIKQNDLNIKIEIERNNDINQDNLNNNQEPNEISNDNDDYNFNDNEEDQNNDNMSNEEYYENNTENDTENDYHDKYYKVDPEWNSILEFDDNIEEVPFD